MEAIESLMLEHRVIERGLAALEGFAGKLGREGLDGRAELGRFVDFIRGYADRLHHAKEEDLLFTRLADSGLPADTGPIAVMLHEHGFGRGLVGELCRLAAVQSPWSNYEASQVSGLARQYAALLRDHIRKEDAILYPMAEERLSESELDELGAEFDRYAGATMAQERELLDLGTVLVARWCDEDPSGCAPTDCGGCSGCGGIPEI